VIRVGDTVRRPVRAYSASVAHFLHHLESVGFDGAPRHLGIDGEGREVLTYIDGDVGVSPFPAWTADGELLTSVARLQRDLHAAASSYVPPSDAVWDRANLPTQPPADHARNARSVVARPAIVCHNDLCVENVVVRDGRAVAFIDFDFAAPADPLFDIAVAARHWVPIRDAADLDEGRRGIDQPARFRAFCAAHRLGDAERTAVVTLLGDFLDRALVSMRARADAGQPGYAEAWAAGYADQNRRSRAWLDAHAADLAY
jgi:aminoglycoside phosphotransferase (APT) family kinase protein